MFSRIMMILLLGVSLVSLASAKSYTFVLTTASQAGDTHLNAGQYTLKLEGSKVILKDADGHDVTAPAKVEAGSQEFRDTEVSLSQADGRNKIEWIGLAGSKSKVIFE